MSQVIAIAYPNLPQASLVLDTLDRLVSTGSIDLEGATILRKDAQVRFEVEGAISRTGVGATGGLLIGALLGTIIAAPVLGAIFGAASGALSGKMTDIRHVDRFARLVGDQMQPGTAAAVMVVRSADPDRVLAELQVHGGPVIRTTMPDDAEARLRAVLGQSAGEPA